ncbi:MAG: tetratricopeptide repeat protein [Anaerolineae bacterium]|nr:tetratricopeptide repeat protein [Anaerolineae bacterium]
MAQLSGKKIQEQGVALFRKGKFEAALEKFNEALQVLADQPKQAAEIYNDLGVTYKQLGNYPAAHQALDEAMTRFTQLQDKKGEAQTWGNRASIYEAEGRLEEAVETYKISASMLEEVGESELAMYVWQAVSKLRTKQGQYIAAIGAYEEGIENMPEGSLKRKVLQQILKLPGSMLGLAGSGSELDKDK